MRNAEVAKVWMANVWTGSRVAFKHWPFKLQQPKIGCQNCRCKSFYRSPKCQSLHPIVRSPKKLKVTFVTFFHFRVTKVLKRCLSNMFDNSIFFPLFRRTWVLKVDWFPGPFQKLDYFYERADRFLHAAPLIVNNLFCWLELWVAPHNTLYFHNWSNPDFHK